MPSDEMTKEIEAAVENVEVGKEGIVSEEVITEETQEETQEETTTEDTQEETTEGVQKETTEEATTEETTTEETPPAISNNLLGRAVDAGLSVADAHGFSPESLERIIREREIAWKQAYEVSIGAKKADDLSDDDEDPFADMPKFDPDVHDEATIAAFEKLTAIAKQQHETIRNFETRQEDTERAAQETNRRDTVQWFDKQVSNLGEDFADALGAGGYDTLDQGSTQFVKREALANQVSVLLAGYEATGQQMPPRDEVFDVAARLVLHEEYQQIEGKKLSGDLEKRAGQHIQRAGGQRATGKESPMEEAARELDEKYF